MASAEDEARLAGPRPRPLDEARVPPLGLLLEAADMAAAVDAASDELGVAAAVAMADDAAGTLLSSDNDSCKSATDYAALDRATAPPAPLPFAAGQQHLAPNNNINNDFAAPDDRTRAASAALPARAQRPQHLRRRQLSESSVEAVDVLAVCLGRLQRIESTLTELSVQLQSHPQRISREAQLEALQHALSELDEVQEEAARINVAAHTSSGRVEALQMQVAVFSQLDALRARMSAAPPLRAADPAAEMVESPLATEAPPVSCTPAAYMHLEGPAAEPLLSAAHWVAPLGPVSPPSSGAQPQPPSGIDTASPFISFDTSFSSSADMAASAAPSSPERISSAALAHWITQLTASLLSSSSSSSSSAPPTTTAATTSSSTPFFFPPSSLASDMGDQPSPPASPPPAATKLLSWLERQPLADVVALLAQRGVRTVRDLRALPAAEAQQLALALASGGSVPSAANPGQPPPSPPPVASQTRPVSDAPLATSAALTDLVPKHIVPPARMDSTDSQVHTGALLGQYRSPLDTGQLQILGDRDFARGRFGRVFRCVRNGDEVCVAKLIKVPAAGDDTFPRVMHALEEAKHLMRIRHDHVVAYLDVFGHQETAINYVGILTEYCDLGNLMDYALDHGLTLDACVDILRQLTLALAYTHDELALVHCDVKMENILLCSPQGDSRRVCIKLCDFGLAQRLDMPVQDRGWEEDGEGGAADERGGEGVAAAEMQEEGGEGMAVQEEQDDADSTVHRQQAQHGLAAAAPRRLSSASELERSNSKDTLGTGAGAAQPPPPPPMPPPVRGTVAYQAPECFESGAALRHAVHGPFTPAIDIWALGCTLWEMATTESLPLGNGPQVLGRACMEDAAGWPRLRSKYLAMFEAELKQLPCNGPPALPSSPEAAQSRGVPNYKMLCGQVVQALPELLRAMWNVQPDKRPRAAFICEQLQRTTNTFFFIPAKAHA